MDLTLRSRLKASGAHLFVSLGIAAVAALLVFGLWYPYPYREISDGKELFLLVVSVDIALGPLLTLSVFNRKKPRAELLRDLAVIGALQIAALGYGLWTVFQARPVYLVFEIDRFRVVHAIEVDAESLRHAPQELQALPLMGPQVLALRDFKDEREKMDATIAALQGVSLSSRPELWQPYAQSLKTILQVAHPVADLMARFPSQAMAIDQVLRKSGRSSQNTVCLPLVGRKSFWTVFLDPVTAELVVTMNLDSF